MDRVLTARTVHSGLIPSRVKPMTLTFLFADLKGWEKEADKLSCWAAKALREITSLERVRQVNGNF